MQRRVITLFFFFVGDVVVEGIEKLTRGKIITRACNISDEKESIDGSYSKGEKKTKTKKTKQNTPAIKRS